MISLFIFVNNNNNKYYYYYYNGDNYNFFFLENVNSFCAYNSNNNSS